MTSTTKKVLLCLYHKFTGLIMLYKDAKRLEAASFECVKGEILIEQRLKYQSCPHTKKKTVHR